MGKPSKKKNGLPEVMASRGNLAEGKEIAPGKWPGVPWQTIPQALVIAVAVLWIYWPALHGDWLWDDDLDITDNPITQSPTGLWSIWFAPGSQFDYYPIKASVQWLQWHLWGMDTLGYHLTNVFLHILGALLVWRLLSKFGLRLAWLGGLIFAIHPVQVESVAWIVELKNTLSLPPLLLAMCAYVDFEEHGKAKDYGLALGLFLVAILCKLSVALFPLVILLYVWWRRGRIGWIDLKTSMPFFGVALVVGLITIVSGIYDVRFNHNDPGAMPVGGLLARLVAAGLSLSFCFSKVFLPVGLLPIYPKWAIDLSSPVQYLPWLVLGGVIGWLWSKRRSWGRHGLLGLGFFLINLGPCPGFIPVCDMPFAWVMDHFLYLPIIGLIGLVVAALGEMEMQLPASFRFYSFGLVTVMLAYLALCSHSYAKIFNNSETLWTYELQLNPEASVAHYNLGNALFQTGRIPEAKTQFEQALQINPNDADARTNLGSSLFQLGRMPEAMAQFEQALQLNPNDAETHNNLGQALLQLDRGTEAVVQFKAAIQIKPDFAEAYFNLGNVLVQSSQLPEAMEQYEQASRIKPDYAEAHNNLGVALLRAGRPSEAAEQFKQALQIRPDYTDAQNNLSRLQALQKTAPAKQ
jgi:Flp pilus assembly protein TadD